MQYTYVNLSLCPSGGKRTAKWIQDTPGGSQPKSQDHYPAEAEEHCSPRQGQITHSGCLWLQTNGGKAETLCHMFSCVHG